MSTDDDRTCGWQSGFPAFRDAQPRVIRASLQEFIRDAGDRQIRAWDDSIPMLQREADEVLAADPRAPKYTAVLEYRLPMEARRPDVIVLLLGPVVVLELKGKEKPAQEDIDQVAAYARDLRSYHRACADRPVHAVLVPTRSCDSVEVQDGVHIVGPAGLDRLLQEFGKDSSQTALDPLEFLHPSAYRPLPSLVKAARELLTNRSVREIWRAGADTGNAVARIERIIREAAATKTRRLVLLTGVPGSGKTLVGLRVVHAGFLDDLATPRTGGQPTAPAIFLSGNGPLVEVLQYVLKDAGGAGKTFVRGVKDYLDYHVPRKERIPHQHVIVFDEAQRAFDEHKVTELHKQWPRGIAKTEPMHFIELAERIPDWSVVVGLIGGGQEIHVGEEEGIKQWRTALDACRDPGCWIVHAPAQLEEAFSGSTLSTQWEPSLNLNTEIRFHLSPKIHDFVSEVLEGGAANRARLIADGLHRSGHRLLITRHLVRAKQYALNRYEEDPEARFGLVASSKDKVLEGFDVPNSFQATKNVRKGPWYAAEGEQSCRRLDKVMTEFGAQGLELDFTILGWGTDLIREGGRWTNRHAGGYRSSARVRDPHRLRVNAYRVLLTRGRDGTVVFVPTLRDLDETFNYFVECGFRLLQERGQENGL